MMFQNRIRLDDLLGRAMTVQWFEGVAVVQGVCRQIVADSSGRHGFPYPGDILLGVDGTIEVAGTSSPAESVASAGHVLAQMLGDDAPVRLRLVATQATGANAGFRDLQEMSEALAYFERPDADGILRGLYARAAEVPAGTRVLSPLARSSSNTNTDQAPEPHPKNELPARGRSLRLAVAGAGGVIACAAIWLFALGSDGPAAAAVASLETAVRSHLGQEAREERVDKDARKQTVSHRNASSNASVTRRTSPTSTTKSVPAREAQRKRDISLPAVWSIFPRAWSGAEAALVPDAVYDIRPDGSEILPSVPGRLYTSSNHDVSAPRSVYPKLPANPPSAARLDDTVLEMVIGTNGLVERVRLRSAPRNVHEFMLVSAAKAWQFEPARLRGAPVRYLHTVVVTLR